MPFQPGHRKRGGRRRGTLNKLTGEARQVARRLLADPEYQRSLQKRLIRGQSPRVELHLWQLAFGKPAPEGAGASADLLEVLEQLGEQKGQSLGRHRSASLGTNRRDPEEDGRVLSAKEQKTL